jgi:hypothetical protein
MKKYYWTTKEGVKLDVDLMSETHLRNVVKMILRNIEAPIKKRTQIGNIESNFLEEAYKGYEEEYNEFF